LVGVESSPKDIQDLLNRYHTAQSNKEFTQAAFLSQNSIICWKNCGSKARTFAERLQQSDRADEYRQQADLLMAHLQDWEPGMKVIVRLRHWQPSHINLEPEKKCRPKCSKSLQTSSKAQTRRCGATTYRSERNSVFRASGSGDNFIKPAQLKYQKTCPKKSARVDSAAVSGTRIYSSHYRSTKHFHRYRTPSGF